MLAVSGTIHPGLVSELLAEARELRTSPHVLGGASPAEAERVRARLKPILLEAAREQRRLLDSDLAHLNGLKPGGGLTLNEVLEFLLSPEGAPLQAWLERYTKPDRPIRLSIEDSQNDEWNAPPKDAFEADMRSARVESDRTLTRDALHRGVVRSFADAVGRDGRIDRNTLANKGPVASALYTHIQQKVRTTPTVNTTPGQMLHGLEPSTVMRVGRGVDIAPIRARMKGFDAIIDELLQDTQPFRGMKVVAVQHVLPTFVGVLDALERAGVSRSDIHVIGKSYSTVDEMYAWMMGHGYHVDEGSISGGSKDVEDAIKDASRETLERLFDGIDPQTSTERFLIADDGGKLLHALHTYFPEYAHLCSAFEQTARGMQVVEAMRKDGVEVGCPVVNMAHSALKARSEIPLVGENIVFDSLRALDDMSLTPPKTATVLGYGPVGEQVARALKARGIDVTVFDADPAKQQAAADAGHSVMPREQAIGAGELVIGCTGRGSLNVIEEQHLLRDGAVLVNGASGNHELGTERFGMPGGPLLELTFEAKDFTFGRRSSASFRGQTVDLGAGTPGSASAHRVMYAPDTGKETLILRSGHVVNLGRDLPPEFIQVTRALVFASLLQASQTKAAGVVDVDARLQDLIERYVNDDLSAQGLSMQSPDFTRLASWDL